MRLTTAIVFAIGASAAVACAGQGTTQRTVTPPTTRAVTPSSLVATPDNAGALRTVVPSTVAVCSTRLSRDGAPLVPGIETVISPTVTFQVCTGASNPPNVEKFLFRTTNEGQEWTLISRTGIPDAVGEPGVGRLPDAGAITALVFNGTFNGTRGWLGLDGQASDLFLSVDGGVTWESVPELPAGAAVRSIEFTNGLRGTVTTTNASWTTVDNGSHWTKAP